MEADKLAPDPAVSSSAISSEDLAAVVASLEPDQLIAAKEKFHCPRRNLTGMEMVVFWALRIYLVFMFGVVIYQIFTGAR